MTPPSAAAVYEYQTLASVAGAPQSAFAAMSSASVVASLVSSSWLKPRVAGVAPPSRSLPGAAAMRGRRPDREGNGARGQHCEKRASKSHDTSTS